MNAVSLFANIGVAEAYLKKLGVNVVVANEFDPDRAALYQRIYPDSKMICGDITSDEIQGKVEKEARKAKIDILMATPPCQGMSTAGKQKEFDPRNDLFKYALKLILKLRPKYIFFENVPGFMVTKVMHEGVPTLIPDVIRSVIGDEYDLSFNVVKVQDYEVPQKRERTIVLGTRKGFTTWNMPKPSGHIVTMEEAIGWLPKIDPFVRDISEDEFKALFPKYEERKKEALSWSPWNNPPSHVMRNVVAMMHTPTGKSAFENTKPEFQPRKKNGELVKGFKNTYKRQNWDSPAYTIAMDNVEISSQDNVHPGRFEGFDANGDVVYSDARVLTTYELMKIMSIPDDWPVPLDTPERTVRRLLGEGVPSLFVKKIFENLPEIKSQEPKLRGISLFANVGIAEAYLKSLGVDMRVANELLPDRARFYQDVYPDTHMVQGDITDDKVRDAIVREAIDKNINFVMATPPCQGMSRVGKMDAFDERNQLIYYAVDAIKRIRPEYALIENVTMILNTKIKVGDEIMLIPEYLQRELGDRYTFNKVTKVKAMDYSIPQIRNRNIYLLVRKDKNVVWEFPRHTAPVTLEDAIGNLPSVDPELRDGIDVTLAHFPEFEKKKLAAAKVSKWHRPPIHSWRMVEWMQHTPTGDSAIHNPVHYPRKENGDRVKAHYNQYRRLEWDKQSRCLTQNNGVISSLACVHPGRPYVKDGETLYTEPRVFTIYEVLKVSSLPLDWPIPDWADETLIRKVIGEGVPSRLIKVIVEELLRRI